MNPNPSAHSKPRFPGKSALVALAAAFAVWNCDTHIPQLAGSSVGTGNPTELEVSFTDKDGSLPLTGRMDVYAATQIPVPGFSHGPLITKSLSGQTRMNLSAADFEALQDSLWPKSSVEGDSLCRFNVVVTGESQGAVIKGFGFERKSGTFVLREEDSAAVRNENAAVVRGAVAPLVEIRSRIDAGLVADMKHFLFLYGTGFYSQGDSGLFVFPKMPIGEYENFLLSVWDPVNAPNSSGDSLEVFRMNATVKSGKEEILNPVGIQEIIPAPFLP